MDLLAEYKRVTREYLVAQNKHDEPLVEGLLLRLDALWQAMDESTKLDVDYWVSIGCPKD